MITQISITAGAIWEFLDKNEPIELSELLAKIEGANSLILMSLGWLIREGHVVLEADNAKNSVFLRKKNDRHSS